MTRLNSDPVLMDLYELIINHGITKMANAFAILFNEAMLIERERALGAEHYERTPHRKGYANGFKPKTVNTGVGRLELAIPQTRGCEFYPSALEKGSRSDRALKLAVAEMYVQGVSTRKVSAVVEKLCGLEVSSSQVSRATKLLDEELEKWRNRELGQTPYLVLDARYEKVRYDGSVVSCAVLTAIGVLPNGKRTVLGVSVSRSEAEVHWREFLTSLLKRGLHGVVFVSSDAHEGLRVAREAVFAGVPWNRCTFHLQRNAGVFSSNKISRREVAAELRAVFNAKDRHDAERLLKNTVEKYERKRPDFAKWLEENIYEGLNFFSLPPEHWVAMRTTNGLEHLNKEIKRRTRVATLFPNDEAVLRLVSAILAEQSEEWESRKRYLDMTIPR